MNSPNKAITHGEHPEYFFVYALKIFSQSPYFTELLAMLFPFFFLLLFFSPSCFRPDHWEEQMWRHIPVIGEEGTDEMTRATTEIRAGHASLVHGRSAFW